MDDEEPKQLHERICGACKKAIAHHLKTLQPYFDEVVAGRKRFEVRLNDRGFQVDDTLVLHELGVSGQLTQREHRVRVSYILGDVPGLLSDYVVMSIEPIEET